MAAKNAKRPKEKRLRPRVRAVKQFRRRPPPADPVGLGGILASHPCVARVGMWQAFSPLWNSGNCPYSKSQSQPVECEQDATTRAFSLPRRRGEGGRRPDEGWGVPCLPTQPLTPTLSPPPRKGEGASPRRGALPFHRISFRNGIRSQKPEGRGAPTDYLHARFRRLVSRSPFRSKLNTLSSVPMTEMPWLLQAATFFHGAATGERQPQGQHCQEKREQGFQFVL